MADLVVWRKPPPLISKSLYNKATKLTLKETLWVWDDVITIGVSLALITLSILWLALPYTMQGWAIVMLCCAGAALAIGIGFLLAREIDSENDPLKFNYDSGQLSHAGRKQLCLLDRNRKRASGYERSWRMPDIEHNQYSVWITPRQGKERWDETQQEYVIDHGLLFRVIEHRPKQYGWGPRWAMVCDKTRYVKPDGENGQPQRTAMSAKLFKAHPTFEESMEVQAQLEQIAELLEGHGYDRKVQVHEMERMALQLRR